MCIRDRYQIITWFLYLTNNYFLQYFQLIIVFDFLYLLLCYMPSYVTEEIFGNRLAADAGLETGGAGRMFRLCHTQPLSILDTGNPRLDKTIFPAEHFYRTPHYIKNRRKNQRKFLNIPANFSAGTGFAVRVGALQKIS